MTKNKLHFYCLVDSQAGSGYKKLTNFKREMQKHYPCEFTIKQIDGRKVDWVERKQKFYASDEYVFTYTKQIEAEHGTNVDAVLFFIDNRNWKQGRARLNGFKLGRVFNGFYVAFTRLRRGYKDTAEHEVLHFIDEYVKVNTGRKLEDILQVKDFDTNVVHGLEYWQKGYYYDQVWQAIAPHISEAVHNRRNQTGAQKLGNLLLQIKLLMQVLNLLKYKSNSIPELEIKKHHTTKCYNVPLKNQSAIIGHIDLGTEAGTINEILNGNRSASYHWYIPKHAKYVVEFVPQNKTAWHAGVVHMPSPALFDLLGGANRIIESGEPNRYSYGICYEGINANTPPNQAQVNLAYELMVVKKISHLPVVAHWEVTSYKPRIVSRFVSGIKQLQNK